MIIGSYNHHSHCCKPNPKSYFQIFEFSSSNHLPFDIFIMRLYPTSKLQGFPPKKPTKIHIGRLLQGFLRGISWWLWRLRRWRRCRRRHRRHHLDWVELVHDGTGAPHGVPNEEGDAHQHSDETAGAEHDGHHDPRKIMENMWGELRI